MRTDALPRFAGDFMPWGISGEGEVLGMLAPGPAEALVSAGLMRRTQTERLDFLFLSLIHI